MGSVSNTLCPPRDRNVPRRQYPWEADAAPMSEGHGEETELLMQ